MKCKLWVRCVSFEKYKLWVSDINVRYIKWVVVMNREIDKIEFKNEQNIKCYF